MGRFPLFLEEVHEMFSWPTEDKAILPLHVGGMELNFSDRLENVVHVMGFGVVDFGTGHDVLS
jgi:hypothetical protein